MSAVRKLATAATRTNFTYADYVTWPDEPRFELIKGEAIEMSAPSEAHQAISAELVFHFKLFLRGKKIPRLYHAPFDVRINYNTFDNTVVQPDLLIISDKEKIVNGKHCVGAPDLVVEILSENTRRYDKLKKLNIYLEAGVREYWIVDTEQKIVEVYILENEKYFIKTYSDEDTIPVYVLEGCEISLPEVFGILETEEKTEESNP